MEVYKKYLEELGNGRSIHYTEQGFASYKIQGEECYIDDIYTVPEHRNKDNSYHLADEVAKIAKDNGCKYLTGSVLVDADGTERSVYMMLGYKFKVAKAEDNVIWFYKEI